MSTGKVAYIRELLGKRVADLELSDLRFLKAEASKEFYPPEAHLADVFASSVERGVESESRTK